jgi:ATP-dependent Clp protease adaptor protein ClpS
MTKRKADNKQGEGIGVKDRQRFEKPRKFKVVFLNDDYTPMSFVIALLMQQFRMDESKAKQITLQVHEQGRGIAGVYTREIADTKALACRQLAKQYEHPLLVQVQAE